MYRQRCILATLLILLSLTHTVAAETGTKRPLVIATREAPPFAIKTDDGWQGVRESLS